MRRTMVNRFRSTACHHLTSEPQSRSAIRTGSVALFAREFRRFIFTKARFWAASLMLLFIASLATAQQRPVVNVFVRWTGQPTIDLGLLAYDNSSDWLKADRFINQAWTQLGNGRAVLEIELPTAGAYGFIIFADENGNRKFDRRLIGASEPFALINGTKLSVLDRLTFSNALEYVDNGVNQFETQF